MNEQKNEHVERDVDLVPILSWFAQGIRNFFRSIGRFFGRIGHFFILFLVFLQRNIILIGVCTILGIVAGFYIKYLQSNNYAAQLVVKPNFDLDRQLYANVDLLQTLVFRNDYDELAQLLDVTVEEAAQISRFYIEPIADESDLIEKFDELAVVRDTTTLKFLEYDVFKSSLNNYDYDLHEIQIDGYNPEVLNKITDRVLILPENSGIQAAKTADTRQADFQLRELEAQLAGLDSLIVALGKSFSADTSKDEASTNFYLNNQRGNLELIEIFDRKEQLMLKIEKARQQKYEYGQEISLVSKVVKWGSIERQYNLIKYTLAGFGIGLLLAVIPLIWNFLKNYDTSAA